MPAVLPLAHRGTLGSLPLPAVAALGPLSRPWLLLRRRQTRDRRPWAIGGAVGVAALALLALIFLPSFLSGNVGPSDPVAVTRVVLEADPAGTAVLVVLGDRTGTDVSLNGDLSIELREPDGAKYDVTRTLDASSFENLPQGSVLRGRLGYRFVVPPAAWSRPPRRGGQVFVQVTVAPRGADRFSYTGTDTFP